MLSFKNSLLAKLVTAFSLLSLITVSLVAVMAYVSAREALKQSIFDRLTVAASLKDHEIAQWFHIQYQDVLLSAQLPEIQAQSKIILDSKTSQPLQENYQRAYDTLTQYFSRLTAIKPNLQETSILTTGGIVVFSTNDSLVGRYQPLGATTTYFTAHQSKIKPIFYRSPTTGKPAITFATPILDQENKRIGVLSITLDLGEVDQLIREKTGLGMTGETYLVGRLERQNAFISSDKDATQKYPQGINSLGIDVATHGEQGAGLYLNYEGVPVVGVYHWLENQNLALLAEITQHEAFSPARQLARNILLIGLGSASVLLLAVYLLARLITQPIRHITETALQIRAGNLAAQAPVVTQDEIGILAQTFNEMTEQSRLAKQKLEAYNRTLQGSNENLESMLKKLKKTQSQLIQTEKMSSLGQMVAGIAHEINNPVNFVHGNLICAEDYIQDMFDLLDIYQTAYPKPKSEVQTKIDQIDLTFLKSDFKSLLQSMEIGTDRIKAIVLSLRNFSRLDESESKAVDLHEGIDNTLMILNHRLKQGVKIVKQYNKIPPIHCYPAQLNQVFMNIIMNALDAMESEKSLDPTIKLAISKVNKAEIQVRIQDNGPGIPPEVKPKIFDPFFTTKPVGQGTGIGLGICFQIIEQHNGKIEVSSEVGQGTEFVITLPI